MVRRGERTGMYQSWLDNIFEEVGGFAIGDYHATLSFRWITFSCVVNVIMNK